MAVADTHYLFVYVDIGSYGKDCDSTIFQRSTPWTLCWNYAVTDLFQEQTVQMYHTSLYETRELH